jgi:hypothetical protein
VRAATPSVTPPMASAVLIEIMLRFFDRRYLNATVNEYAISTSPRRV